jgi:hypothetical protein
MFASLTQPAEVNEAFTISFEVDLSRSNERGRRRLILHQHDEEPTMLTTPIALVSLSSMCAFAVIGPAFAACPITPAKIEKTIATKPAFRHSANAQVVRDLRTLLDAAVVLDAYDHEDTCKAVVAVLEMLAADPKRTIKSGDTDEGKAEAVEKARAGRRPPRGRA